MKKTPEDIVNEIQEACSLLGWHISMNESQDTVRGLIIGQAQYVQEVIAQLEDNEEYSVYSSSAAADTDKH